MPRLADAGPPAKVKDKKLLATLRFACRSGTAIPLRFNESGPGLSRAHPFMVNVEKIPFLNESNVVPGRSSPNVVGGRLRIQFDPCGAALLEQYFRLESRQRKSRVLQFGKKLKDVRWLAAPVISHRISDGVFVFTPDATEKEAEEMRRPNNVFKKTRDMDRQIVYAAFLTRSPPRPGPFSASHCPITRCSAGGEERFFVGTAGQDVDTGTFGCVARAGWQLHEGLTSGALRAR